jgi:hypothetical protein
MELGGNLPDTLIAFTMLGHGGEVDGGDEGDGITKREQQWRYTSIIIAQSFR